VAVAFGFLFDELAASLGTLGAANCTFLDDVFGRKDLLAQEPETDLSPRNLKFKLTCSPRAADSATRLIQKIGTVTD